jgi:hypothetical protein
MPGIPRDSRFARRSAGLHSFAAKISQAVENDRSTVIILHADNARLLLYVLLK